MEHVNRSVRFVLECTASSLRKLGATVGCVESRCFYILVERFNRFCFLSFSLIKDCVVKVKRELADLVLVTPFLPSQPWFLAVLELDCEPPLVLPLSNDLLTSARHRRNSFASSDEVHSHNHLEIVRCGFSNCPMVFRDKWSTCLWWVHFSPHTLLTSQPGTAGVIGVFKTVPIPCLLPKTIFSNFCRIVLLKVKPTGQ